MRYGLMMRVAILTSLIVCSLIASCRAEQHFFDVTGELFVLSAAEHYDEALERARDWQPDAYLVGIKVLPASADGRGADALLSFEFDSSSAPDSFYDLNLWGETWSSEVIEKASGAGMALPIERDDWLLDSVDAWSIALANGGEDFLFRHQDPLTSMSATLDYWRMHTSENVLAWRVHYFILFGSSLDMLIDPQTGDILEVKTDW